MDENKYISIKGARVNNLKNIDVDIPRDKLIVITGVSGSGKSSLAFDTLYAEGQRRYVESLSSYARQFLGRMSKPECDFIKGIPPAIAIEQKVTSRNARSTVGTSTEIYEFLRLLFARIGKTYSPVSGKMVKKHAVEDVLLCVKNYEEGTRFMIMAPLEQHNDRDLQQQLDIYLKSGFNRVDIKGNIKRIEDALIEYEEELKKNTIAYDEVKLLIDRLTISNEKDFLSRMTDSVETAFFEGNGNCELHFLTSEGTVIQSFSKCFEADGITFEEPSDQLFSFNSPLGACPECEGYGRVVGIDPDLVVPNKSLSIYEGAIVCWRGEKMGEWKQEFIREVAPLNFPIFKPYYDLTEEEKEILWHGTKDVKCHIDAFFGMLQANQYKIQYRVMLARYRGKTKCPSCKGQRLKKEALYVRIGNKTIADVVEMPIAELHDFFTHLQLNEQEVLIAKRLLTEIKNRIQFLMDVGLGYLTLNRSSNTLSGGESQRINLTTSLGSSLVGSLYILDEPSIGLHSRDTHRLISVLKHLQSLGNTVVVVEHDEEIMRAADYLIDIGPQAGRLGGKVVFQGTIDDMNRGSESFTAQFLLGEDKLVTMNNHRTWNNSIQVLGARANNLKGIDVSFPLNVMTVVTGVSGSGKSTLVHDVFFRAMRRQLGEGGDLPGEFQELKGDINAITAIELVNQDSIGRSSRSNPVTYLKAYDDIRKLFAEQTLAKQMGYKPTYFSFNAEGGRCEECKGEGKVTVEMQFMADLRLECESCHGKRFKKETLEVLFHEKNIYDILEMTVNQALEFFQKYKQTKIVKKLNYLSEVGLGYVKLGQSSSTLSGGESQRVKLARFLSNENSSPTLYIFDEPTTGLHYHDIQKLLHAFNALIERGHTVLIIEHNLDIIKCADHIIDLGPEGGKEGGNLVFSGTLEDLMKDESSYTAQYLRENLKKH